MTCCTSISNYSWIYTLCFPFRTDVPGIPQDVQVLEVTKTSATITWKIPETDGGSPIVGYIIERTLAGRERWLRANNQLVPELTYCVPELVEDNEYTFRVIAENKVGPGQPSEPTKPVVARDPWRKYINFVLSCDLYIDDYMVLYKYWADAREVSNISPPKF